MHKVSALLAAFSLASTGCRVSSGTEADGRHEFELSGSDTQGTLGTESTLDVVFPGRAAQSSATIRFTAKDIVVRLPVARLWRAQPKLSRHAGRIGLAWSALPAAADRDATYAAQLFDEDGAALWTRPGTGGHASIDPRILEDRPGDVGVSADVELDGGRGAGDVLVHYLSHRLPVRATAGAPPARGRPCASVTGTAPEAVRPSSPCAATDADLTTPAQLSAREARVVTGVVIDIGAARPVRLIVARGLAGQVLVEVSIW